MKKLVYLTMAIMLAAVMLVPLMASPAMAEQGEQIRVTDAGPRGDQPDIAIDSNGNLHIAYSNGGRVWYQNFGSSPDRYTVIQWDVGHYSGYGHVLFQAVLHESGTITMNIADSSGVSGCVTGVNEGDGTHGVDIGGTPGSNTSHQFTWNSGISDYDYTSVGYNWIDASGGNHVPLSDDDSASVPLGFNFTFYGSSYNSVYVSSNGYMSFTDTSPTEYSNPASFPTADSYAQDVVAPLWDDWNPYLREIWYTMLDSCGNTLINDTQISVVDGINSTRPAIVVDSGNYAHITWRDQRWDGYDCQEVTYSKINPYADDRNGDSASEGAITVIDDTRLTNHGDWNIHGIRMAVDSSDNIHIVYDNYDSSDIWYMKMDSNGNVLIPSTSIRYASQWRALPDIAIDSNDNLHIAWCDDEATSYEEVYYMMLDGSDGSILIDATLITPDDSNYSKWTAIVVDNNNDVHIVWQDKKTGEHEIYYTKLDPYQDDRNGDAASAGAITEIAETRLTPDDGQKSRHPAAAISPDDRYIHITWEESAGPNIHYLVLNRNGAEVISETPLTTTNSANPSTYWTIPYLDVDTSNRAHVVWCDDRDGDYNVYYTSYPECPAPPPPPQLEAWYSIYETTDPEGAGTVELNPDQLAYRSGDTVTVTASPAQGYTFDQWGGDLSGTGVSQSLHIDFHKSVTAYFELEGGALFRDRIDDQGRIDQCTRINSSGQIVPCQ